MKVFVTGVEGYIGSLLAPLLMQHGHDVVGTDTGFYRDGWLYSDSKTGSCFPRFINRDSVREWVKRDVSPIIEDYAQRAEFPTQIIKGLAGIGAFGPYIPAEYGGGGMDQI